MSRIKRRRRSSSSGINWLAVAIIIFVLTALAGMFKLAFDNEPKTLDEVTLCIKGEAHPATLGIIIDSTDSFPAAPAAKAFNIITTAVDQLPVNSRVQLFQIKGSSDLLKPLVDICKPDDGSTASQLNSNPAYIKKLYRERFSTPLEQTLKRLIKAEPQSSSPIIESMQAASIQALMPFESTSNKRLIVASDFLQHSDLYSMYESKPNLQDFTDQSITSSLGRINFSGAKVDLLVIPRRIPNGSRGDLVSFWGDFLIQHNAALGSSWEPL